MTNFRVTSDTAEIFNLFKLLQNTQNIINIWQTHFQQRQMADAQIISVDNDHLLLQLTEEIEVIPEKHIYFYCEEKTVVFKINHYSLKKRTLKISIPKELTLEELRSESRFNLSNVKNTTIEFEIMNDQIEDENKGFSARMYDISSGGLSFLIPVKNKDLLVIDDILKLQRIAKDTINLKGKILHVHPYTSKTELVKTPLLKVGIKLENNLDLNSLHVFRQLLQQ